MIWFFGSRFDLAGERVDLSPRQLRNTQQLAAAAPFKLRADGAIGESARCFGVIPRRPPSTAAPLLVVPSSLWDFGAGVWEERFRSRLQGQPQGGWLRPTSWCLFRGRPLAAPLSRRLGGVSPWGEPGGGCPCRASFPSGRGVVVPPSRPPSFCSCSGVLAPFQLV